MQGAQLAELESLYKEEQVLRKRYFNTIEGGKITPYFPFCKKSLFRILAFIPRKFWLP